MRGELTKEVFSVEIVQALATRAETVLKSLGCSNVFVKAGDGYGGWPEKAPFDVIILTAAVPEMIPNDLFLQLKQNGRLIAPAGSWDQQIVRWTKLNAGDYRRESFIPVKFVPMTGKVQMNRMHS